MKSNVVLMLSLGIAFSLHAENPVPGGGIDSQRLGQHVRTLSSDAFQGRAPATPGEDRTVSYLIEQFREAGLQPGGGEGGWTQAVPLVRTEVAGLVKMSLNVGGERWLLANGDEMVVQSLKPVERVDVQQAPLVFVGYGIDAPERGWDDYKGVDLAGKIAVMLINDADFETPAPGAFDGRAVTYYGRWTYKFEEAARRGAEGVLIVHETAPAAYGWATVKSSGLSPQFDIERKDAARHHTTLRGWMQRDLAATLFKHVGLDFEVEKRKAQRTDFRPVPLGDASLSVAFDLKREEVVSHNIAGLLPGSTHPDETIIYSGHWDAFGVGAPDDNGDRIRRGAVDNATGVAAVLELARVFAAGPQAQRSQLFIALTAEEKGLQGASHYAAHPLAPLDKTVAVFNVEMLSPDGPTRDISSWGKGRVSLEGDLEAAAKARGRIYSPDPNLEAGFFYRADHFAFARAGVPAITIGPGLDRLQGGVASGKALREAYFANCYHQPCDAWNANWNLEGQAQDVTLLYDMGERLANSREWPQWQDGSEFKAIRTATDAVRE